MGIGKGALEALEMMGLFFCSALDSDSVGRLLRCWQTDFANQFGEARVGTDVVESRRNIQTDQQAVVLAIGSIEPFERLVSISDVGIVAADRKR